MAKPRTADPAALKRDSAGRYASADGRFVVEQASGGWMATDAEQRNELGLPLVRGPFGTLAEAKAAVLVAREGPAPESKLAARIASLPARPAPVPVTPRAAVPEPAPLPEPEPPLEPEPPPPVIREWRPADGDQLRRLWDDLAMLSPWDDDASLQAMARRNPGLLLVAAAGDEIIGSALGAWDGRRGWIYHVAIAPDHQRQGIGRELVARIEAGLRALGCPKVNVVVLDDNSEGVAFWIDLGYTSLPARQFGRRLAEDRLRAT
jgi:ribosomal protein S18 acetylase RimI-like enzyme